MHMHVLQGRTLSSEKEVSIIRENKLDFWICLQVQMCPYSASQDSPVKAVCVVLHSPTQCTVSLYALSQ